MGCEKADWLNLGSIILRGKWKMSLDNVQFSAICIKINHSKKYAFVYNVQMIKQAIHKPQDPKLHPVQNSRKGGGG